MLRGVQNGSAPDVIEIGMTWTSRLAYEGLILDITKYVGERVHGPAVFFPRLLNTCRSGSNGERYTAVPFVADVRVLFYNDDILADFLAKHPHAGGVSPPRPITACIFPYFACTPGAGCARLEMGAHHPVRRNAFHQPAVKPLGGIYGLVEGLS